MTQVELYSRLHLVLATVASEYDRRAQAYGCVIITEVYLIGHSLATAAATKQVFIRDAGGVRVSEKGLIRPCWGMEPTICPG